LVTENQIATCIFGDKEIQDVTSSSHPVIINCGKGGMFSGFNSFFPIVVPKPAGVTFERDDDRITEDIEGDQRVGFGPALKVNN
jgi:hypothetical protein